MVFILLVTNIVSADHNSLCQDLEAPENVDAYIEDLFRKNALSISDFSSKDLSMEFYSIKRIKCGDIETVFLAFRQEYDGIPIIWHETRMIFSDVSPISSLTCYGILAEPSLDFRSKEYQEKKEKGTLILCGEYYNFSNALTKPIISESEARKIAEPIFTEWDKRYFGDLHKSEYNPMLVYWIRTQQPELSWVFGQKVDLKDYPRPINANLIISAKDGEILFKDSGFRTSTDSGPTTLESNLLFVWVRNVVIFFLLVGIVVFLIYRFKKRYP